MRDPLQRLYRTKLALLATIFVFVGAALLVVVHWPGLLPQWLQNLPLSEAGSTLFATGLFSIAFDYAVGRDNEERTEALLREVLKSEAPAIREAVVRGFAVETQDLKRVASPELLDQIAENSIGLRFGDRDFAREVYGDIRDQAIKAEERWYDARVQIDVGIPDDPAPAQIPVFDFLVRWDYTVSPKHRFRHFVVVSNRERYEQLAGHSNETSVWLHPAVAGLPATAQQAFELVELTVDGQARDIARHVDDTSQTYTVDLGAEIVATGKPVTVSFTYRSRLAQHGHNLRLDVDRPTRGLTIELNHDNIGVASMRMFDYTANSLRPKPQSEANTPSGRRLRFAYDGWLFPRAGVVFVWVLGREMPMARPIGPQTQERPPHHRGSVTGVERAATGSRG